jgi:hypothetical protein
MPPQHAGFSPHSFSTHFAATSAIPAASSVITSPSSPASPAIRFVPC